MNSQNQIKNEVILTGRIYPAILNCVNNRYKIIAGYIAIVGFLLVADEVFSIIIKTGTLWILPAIFTVFVILNSCNYYYNTKDQIDLESVTTNTVLYECRLDITFSFVMVVLIWMLFYYLNAMPCSS